MGGCGTGGRQESGWDPVVLVRRDVVVIGLVRGMHACRTSGLEQPNSTAAEG